MKVLIISDSHGHIANLKLALVFAKKIKAGAIIHCGDWGNLKAVEEVKKENIPLYAVLGNADNDPQMKKIFSEELLELRLDNRKIGVIHNHRHLKSVPAGLDILFCGHIHSRFEKEINGLKVVRPGPIHSDKPTCAVYDTVQNRVLFFDL